MMLARASRLLTPASVCAAFAQTSWIMNDTLQENVLMGSDMDADRWAPS